MECGFVLVSKREFSIEERMKDGELDVFGKGLKCLWCDVSMKEASSNVGIGKGVD